jgi:hypothetical protein
VKLFLEQPRLAQTKKKVTSTTRGVCFFSLTALKVLFLEKKPQKSRELMFAAKKKKDINSTSRNSVNENIGNIIVFGIQGFFGI